MAEPGLIQELFEEWTSSTSSDDDGDCGIQEPVWNFFAWLFFVLAVNLGVLLLVKPYFCCIKKLGCFVLRNVYLFLAVWIIQFVLLTVAGYLIWLDGGGWSGHTWQLIYFVVHVSLIPGWFILFFWLNMRGIAVIWILGLLAIAIGNTVIFWLLDLAAGIVILVYTIILLYLVWWTYKVYCCNRGLCYYVQYRCVASEKVPVKKCVCPTAPNCVHVRYAHSCQCPNPCGIHASMTSDRPPQQGRMQQQPSTHIQANVYTGSFRSDSRLDGELEV